MFYNVKRKPFINCDHFAYSVETEKKLTDSVKFIKMVLCPRIWDWLIWIFVRWDWYSILSRDNFLLDWSKIFWVLYPIFHKLWGFFILAGGDMDYSQSCISPNSKLRKFCAYRICFLSLKFYYPLHDVQCIVSYLSSSFRLLCWRANEP